MKIWDTSGEEQFNTIVRSLMREVGGVLVVYSTTDVNSFEECESHLRGLEKTDKTVILVGNKCDNLFERTVTK